MVDLRATQHALPRERRYYASVETTYGTRVQAAGADAVRILNAVTGAPQPVRVERVDNRQTRSVEDRITGSTPPIEWSLEGYLIPSGAAGTAPDMGAVLAAAFGVETIVGATSVTYSPSDVQGALGSLSITDEASEIYMQALAGGWVEELTLRGAGGDAIMVAASGGASSHVGTGRSEVTTVVTITVTPTNIDHVEIGSRVKFVDAADGVTTVDDNAGAGFVVLTKAASSYTVNASPAGVTPGDQIVPFVPTEVTAGSPSPGIVGSCVLDGVTLPLQSWEVTLKNNLQPHSDEAFQANTTGYHEDNRQVTGQIAMRARADQVAFLQARKSFAKLALQIIVGDSAGDITTLDLPGVELNFAALDQAQPETAIITLPFQALGTGDEYTLAFT